MVDGFNPGALITDKGYDCDNLVKSVEDLGIQVVIPSRKNKTKPHEYDRHLYKERHLVEYFINKIKP